MNRYPLICALLGGASLLALSNPALAQDAPAQQPEEEAIIVTAQNRAENVQDVPIAINVVTAEAIQRAGVTDFTAVERIAPAVQIVNDTVNTRVAVRGVGTNSNDEAQDQAIAINIDGEYLNRPTMLNASLFDLERVEVLRGPQGTLYGRNATGGAINFITRKPGTDFGGNLAATSGNLSLLTLEGGIDLPLSERAALRISGIYSDRAGYNRHPNQTRRSGDDHTTGVRLSLSLDPTDALSADFALERVEKKLLIPAQAWVNINSTGNTPGAACGGVAGWVQIAPTTPNTECIPQNTNYLSRINRNSYDAPLSGIGEQKADSTAFRSRIGYDLGFADLTYTLGYRTAGQTNNTTLSPAYVFYGYQDDVETLSQELRVNGETESGVLWQAGVFSFKEELTIERGLFNRFVGPNGSYINYFRRPTVEAKSLAAFGQVDFPLSETLTGVVGIRYTTDDRDAVYENLGFQFNAGPVRLTTPATPAQTLKLAASADKFTWLLGLNYQPNDDTLVYGKVSTGFKAGGFDAVGAYDPESNTAYEAGMKLNFGERSRNLLNLSAFYYDYKDLQVSVLLDTTKGAQVFNAGKATIWGLEAETDYRIGENGTFTASVNYLNAEYKELLASYSVFCVGCSATGLGDLDNNPATITQPDLSGNTPPQSPKWTVSVGYDHEFDLGTLGSLTAGANTVYKSEYFTDIFNFNDSRQDAYTQTNAELTWRPTEGDWTVQAYVRNIENERPLTYAGFTAAGPDDIYNWQFGAPRLYGVRVTSEF